MAIEYWGHTNLKTFKAIDNFIYLHHLDALLIIPSYPDRIVESLPASFNQSAPLSRSAPIYSYSHSGPHTTSLDIPLHRDMVYQINQGNGKLQMASGEDIIDTFVEKMRAASLPAYSVSAKMVNPPVASVKIGTDFYMKGILSNVSVTKSVPVINDGKFACVSVRFDISEIGAYDAQTVWNTTGFLGVDSNLAKYL